ncbi:PaaI family thioesterase [Streptococcus caprae]|uniref:PaaI family thioesterase n=1 Tax=Streptococcus caprae TaxID=1640501 RepID=A0ABV8CWP3_9STRE
MTKIRLHEIVAFDNYEVISIESGHVVVSTVVSKQSLNVYGNAHGGFLFTLCDQISGMTVMSTGFDAVTLQSNVNYLKGAKEGDTLTIEGQMIHNGRTTKVVEVTITNKAQQLVTRGSFTMFVIGQHDD